VSKMFAGLESRIALVTGGASGIGYGVAEALLVEGAKVAIGDISAKMLDRAAAALNTPNLLPLQLDVTSSASVRQAVRKCTETFGGLNTLINSAGIIEFVPVEEILEENWQRVIAVDLTGVFLCCQAATPFLRRSGRGRIVTISSDAGKIGVALLSSYCAAKAGVIGFSKALAGELAPDGTTVNCVCPGGVTATQMGEQVLNWLSAKTAMSRDELLAERAKNVPVGRMQTTADVVGAVIFLISDAASYITGEALNIDGGGLGTSRIKGL
jgi:meso-butanediol dehydrogenase/(S,S)-butanediol dehydrogenase/diacetyl reductase